MGYAFISYSSENRNVADEIRALFKNKAIETWMAPYDIPAGSKYAAEITRAVRNCSCFVLVLSDAAQASDGVDAEVEFAKLTFKKPIITVQIEEVELNDSFMFYLKNTQIEFVKNIDESSENMQKILNSVSGYTGQTTAKAQDNTEKYVKTYTIKKDDPQDSWAQYNLGFAYEFGTDTVEKDHVQAVKWYTLSAEQGNAWAQNRLGDCYRFGNGVTQDYKKAVELYTLSAEQGDKTAERNLGICYFYGYGVNEDKEKAAELYKLAAEQGDAWAKAELEKCAEEIQKKKTEYKELSYSDCKDLEYKIGNGRDSFTVPREYTSISESAFRGISAKNIYIPSTVKTIHQNCFKNMSRDIQRIYVSIDNPHFYVNTVNLIEKATGKEIPAGDFVRIILTYREH